MKKKSILLLMGALAISSLSFNADAQGLSGLIRKGTKVAANGTSKTTQVKESAKTNAVILDNGISVINPISDFIEITPIGLYGVSKSDNYGDAYLVLKAEIKIPKQSAAFGSSIKNQKMIAADNGGNIYNIDASGAFRYDLIEGMPVVVKIDDPAAMFLDIPKNITMMPVVKFGVNIDAYHQDNITLKNVPIFWDEYPE